MTTSNLESNPESDLDRYEARSQAIGPHVYVSVTGWMHDEERGDLLDDSTRLLYRVAGVGTSRYTVDTWRPTGWVEVAKMPCNSATEAAIFIDHTLFRANGLETVYKVEVDTDAAGN